MLLIILCLLTLASAEELVVLSAPSTYPPPLGTSFTPPPRYHELVGVPEAARIRRGEARGVSRVAGGAEALLGTYKFYTGLLIRLTTNQSSLCGGSLISGSRVLTAATCWFDGRLQARAMLAVLGSVRLFSGGVRVSATKIAVHPHYNYHYPSNNIAVLTIPSVAATAFIQPISLVNTTTITFYGHTAHLIGFGRTDPECPVSRSQRLHSVPVRVISDTVCRMSPWYYADHEHMCTAGAGARGACGGDAGAPLAHISNTLGDYLIGVVNLWRTSDCAGSRPTSYTRVGFHHDWITAVLQATGSA